LKTWGPGVGLARGNSGSIRTPGCRKPFVSQREISGQISAVCSGVKKSALSRGQSSAEEGGEYGDTRFRSRSLGGQKRSEPSLKKDVTPLSKYSLIPPSPLQRKCLNSLRLKSLPGGGERRSVLLPPWGYLLSKGGTNMLLAKKKRRERKCPNQCHDSREKSPSNNCGKGGGEKKKSIEREAPIPVA